MRISYKGRTVDA